MILSILASFFMNQAQAACDQTLNVGANVVTALKNAAAGSTVCLNPGNYGKIAISGVTKTAAVTLQSSSGQTAVAEFNVETTEKVNIRSMTITYMYIHNQAKNLVVSESQFKGQLLIQLGINGGSDYGNANILIDNNTFDGISVDPNAYEGRIQVLSEQNSGVQISNNHIGNAGEADGIQLGANGVTVGPGNVFQGIRQMNYSRHVDSIQLLGAVGTKIIGNYFFDNDVIIMAPDGSGNTTVMNNVMIGGGAYVPAIQFGSATNLNFTHNTVKNCNLHVDKKSERPDPSQNAIVRNNLLVNASINAPAASCTNCLVERNLFSIAGNASGGNNVIGQPTFTGGVNPATWSGYQLSSASLGYKAGTDGLDLGTTVYGASTSTPPVSGKVWKSNPTTIMIKVK